MNVRGIIAQVDANLKVRKILDLWNEDTEQDSWFNQSVMDVGFRWLEKTFPGFWVYLLLGKQSVLVVKCSFLKGM